MLTPSSRPSGPNNFFVHILSFLVIAVAGVYLILEANGYPQKPLSQIVEDLLASTTTYEQSPAYPSFDIIAPTPTSNKTEVLEEEKQPSPNNPSQSEPLLLPEPKSPSSTSSSTITRYNDTTTIEIRRSPLLLSEPVFIYKENLRLLIEHYLDPLCTQDENCLEKENADNMLVFRIYFPNDTFEVFSLSSNQPTTSFSLWFENRMLVLQVEETNFVDYLKIRTFIQ